jgi:hypothetical protein
LLKERGKTKKMRQKRTAYQTMILILILSMLLGTVSHTFAPLTTDPPLSVEWERTFGGMGGEVAYSVQQTSDGGYILVGVTNSYGAGNEDIWLVKTDRQGYLLWNRTFGGELREEAQAVQQTMDGGYILAGYTSTFGVANSDFWMVKTDGSGKTEWSRTFGGRGYEAVYDVQQTTDDGYILGGFTTSYGAGNSDGWIVKTDAHGAEQWKRTFGGEGNDQIYSVQQTADEGYILAGIFECGDCWEGKTKRDLWLIKIAVNGNPQWNLALGGIGPYSEARVVKQTADGGYVVAGFTGGTLLSGKDIWLGKLNTEGILQWNASWVGETESDDWIWAVQETDDGGYLLAGYVDAHAWVGKADQFGTKVWELDTIGGELASIPYSLQPTADGGYILAGYTESFGAVNGDFWLVKLGFPEETTTSSLTAVPEIDFLITYVETLSCLLVIVLVQHKRHKYSSL